jgi:hypothetical protein
MRKTLLAMITLAAVLGGCAADGNDDKAPAAADGWRNIPLVKDGGVAPAWKHTGYGSFVVEADGSLRTECDPRGLGLLVYTKEKLGDCQLRVVYRSKDPASNAGVYVRIADDILKRLGDNVPAASRNANGEATPEGVKAMEEASDKELGPWYAVHHGYEVQIADAGDEFHRTGAVYSFTRAERAPEKPRDQWRTMLITLKGNTVQVDIDGRRVSEFDSEAKDLPPRRQWHEPRREPKRPQQGYVGLQNHDPGDVVYFKEVGVRPLGAE